MICERTIKKFCKDDISLIENYEKAVNDATQTWDCHHRRETVMSRKDLIEIGEYYNRPAVELIFLTKSEHNRLHKSGENHPFFGKHHSAEACKKMSESHKGKNHSDETRQKLSETNKGKHLSVETRQKMSEAHKGKPTCIKGTNWYNNGVKSILAKECPKGFVKGRIKK